MDKYRLYRLVAGNEYIMFAALNDSHAMYVVDLHADGQHVFLTRWDAGKGQWEAVDLSQPVTTEPVQYVTY